MVTYNKRSLVRHNLLDERFFRDIIENSNILTEYNLKFYKINDELEHFAEDLYYIFYKHIVTIEKEANIHSFLLEKIVDSIGYKKLTFRTTGSTFETYLVLKYFMDQIFVRLKGTNHMSDISSYFKNDELYSNELTSIKEEIENLINNKIDQNDNVKKFIDNNERKILKTLIENKVEESKTEKLLISSEIKAELLSDLEELINENFDLSFSSDYSDFLNELLEHLPSNLNQDEDNTLEPENTDNEKDDNKKTQSSLDMENNDDTDNDAKKDNISDFKDELIESLENLIEEDVDAEDFLESLVIQIEELSAVSSDLAHEKGDLSSDSDSNESSKDASDYTDNDSSNSLINQVSNSEFENPFTDEINGDVDEKHIVDGEKNDSLPIYEEIIDTIEFVNKTEKKANNNANDKLISDIFKDLIKRLELLQAKIIMNEKNITKLSNDIKMESDLASTLKKLDDTLSNVGTLGISKASLSALNMDEVIELEKRLRTSDFKRFIDKIGKKNVIAARAKKKKALSKDHLIDKIVTSDDMDNIIEDEILQFALDIDEFEWDFYDRLLNKAVLSNQFVSKHGKNKGPIILCYDGSGSMEGAKIEETKAHIIAILDIAKYQKRKVILIQFASKNEDLYTKEVNPAYISTSDIYDIYDTFIKGGTDFEKPLKKAMHMLKQENYKEGDILFITDGHCEINDKFVKEFNLAKHIRRFKLYSIIIHGHTYSDYGDLAKVSDEVLEIKKSNLNDWNEKISEKIFSII